MDSSIHAGVGIRRRQTGAAVIRTRLLRPGDVVRVHRCQGAYTDLPQGLADESRVKIMAVDIGYACVADTDGRQFEVAFSQIEMPKDVWWHGHWIDRVIDPDGEKAYRWALESVSLASGPQRD